MSSTKYTRVGGKGFDGNSGTYEHLKSRYVETKVTSTSRHRLNTRIPRESSTVRRGRSRAEYSLFVASELRSRPHRLNVSSVGSQ